jgi:hypothetical protein
MLRCSVSGRLRGDAHAGQLAEAGVDAVDRLALGDDALDRAPRPRSPAARAAGSSHRAAPR